jgi:hypothetical protein
MSKPDLIGDAVCTNSNCSWNDRGSFFLEKYQLGGDLALKIKGHHINTFNGFYGHRKYDLFVDGIPGVFSLLGNSYFIEVNYSETPREQLDKLFKRPQK